MKRIAVIIMLVLVAVSFTGCEAILAWLAANSGPSARSQVEDFLEAASSELRDPLHLQTFFDPASDGYDQMGSEAYWDGTVFALADVPFDIPNMEYGEDNAAYPDGTTIVGAMTTGNNSAGFPVEFVLLTDETGEEAVPLIRAIIFPDPNLQVIDAFLEEASVVPYDPEALKAFFDADCADYPSMQTDAYWEDEFFNPLDAAEGSYVLLDPVYGAEDPEFEGQPVIVGDVQNWIAPYPAVFVMTENSTYPGTPWIRKITVTVAETDEIIKKVIGQ